MVCRRYVAFSWHTRIALLLCSMERVLSGNIYWIILHAIRQTRRGLKQGSSLAWIGGRQAEYLTLLDNRFGCWLPFSSRFMVMMMATETNGFCCALKPSRSHYSRWLSACSLRIRLSRTKGFCGCCSEDANYRLQGGDRSWGLATGVSSGKEGVEMQHGALMAYSRPWIYFYMVASKTLCNIGIRARLPCKLQVKGTIVANQETDKKPGINNITLSQINGYSIERRACQKTCWMDTLLRPAPNNARLTEHASVRLNPEGRVEANDSH